MILVDFLMREGDWVVFNEEVVNATPRLIRGEFATFATRSLSAVAQVPAAVRARIQISISEERQKNPRGYAEIPKRIVAYPTPSRIPSNGCVGCAVNAISWECSFFLPSFPRV